MLLIRLLLLLRRSKIGICIAVAPRFSLSQFTTSAGGISTITWVSSRGRSIERLRVKIILNLKRGVITSTLVMVRKSSGNCGLIEV